MYESDRFVGSDVCGQRPQTLLSSAWTYRGTRPSETQVAEEDRNEIATIAREQVENSGQEEKITRADRDLEAVKLNVTV